MQGILSHWLPLAITIIGLSSLIYVVAQQQYRQSLNDPQIQITQDLGQALSNGLQPKDLVPADHTFDIQKSLTTFIAVFDEHGSPIASTGMIDGNEPKPPVGVFDHARSIGEYRVTWQPHAGTRIALVIRYVPGKPDYFAVAGRNMREIESRVSNLGVTLACGTIAILSISCIFDLLGDAMRRRMMADAKK